MPKKPPRSRMTLEEMFERRRLLENLQQAREFCDVLRVEAVNQRKNAQRWERAYRALVKAHNRHALSMG